MLSYRHAFHAGNHADVLKHMVLIAILRYMAEKDKPLMYADTHAGAGLYALDGGYAQKSGESSSGIRRLWERSDLPPMVAQYVNVVRELNPDRKLRLYPGSPYCASAVLRPEDRLRLFELHPTDGKLLEDNAVALDKQIPTRGRRILVQHGNGFEGVRACLPPPSRRGVLLIDPPYEVKTDYVQVTRCLQDALTRFSTGTYAVWYPQLQRQESRKLPDALKRLVGTAGAKSWLHVALTVKTPTLDGVGGLHSSGMFVLNPPWTLLANLQQTMPWLTQALAQDGGARFTLEGGEA